MFERAGVITTGLAFLALTLAGCAVDEDFENLTGPTGTVTFCVQDENNVNFNGVFVNFGDIEINQETNVNVDDTDVATDDTAGTDDAGATDTTGTDATTASPTDTADTNTTAATTETEGTDTTATTTETGTVTAGPEEGEPARTIQVTDIECVRTEGADFDIGDVDARGQAYGNDRTADTNDAQTDDDEGIGNDDNEPGRGLGRDDDGETERVNVEVDEVDLLRFQDRNAAFLAEAEVKPGTFRNVMIDVESVRVTTDDGEEREIEVDLKKIHLKGPIEVREDQDTLVVFKVDLERSIVSTGSGDVRFKPVMHVQVTAPQVPEIVIRETTTVTTTATNETMTDTMTTGDTMTTTTGTETATATATATATETASPTATTTTSPSPT